MIFSDVFVSGAEYPFFRIPGIITTSKGTLIAATECRMTLSDWDTRAIAVKRSEDGGRTWGDIIVIDSTKDDIPVGNPTLIADGGRVWIVWVTDYVNMFVSYSDDDGRTFSPKEPTDALESLRRYVDFRVAAPGPGHGVSLPDGRLIVPFWLAFGGGEYGKPRSHRPSVVSFVYKDDTGWHAADGVIGNIKNLSETSAVWNDGRLMFDLRNEDPNKRRAVAWYENGRLTNAELDPDFPDPICFGSLVMTGSGIIGVNCSNERERRTLALTRIKADGFAESGHQIIWDKAGYADITPSADGGVHVFFEHDDDGDGHVVLSVITLSKDEIVI